MQVSKIFGFINSQVHKAASNATNQPNQKALAKEKAHLLELARLRREKAREYHIMPELNFLGLWK